MSWSLSSLLLLTALATSNAFAPGNHQHQQHHAIAAPSSCSKIQSSIIRRSSVVPIAALRQSSNDDDGDGSSTVNIALITSTTTTTNYNDELQKVLKEHPFCKFSGIQLSFADVQATSETSWSKENIATLQQAELVCFDTISSVKTYLKMLDKHLNAPEDISDEDRKKLPNKPDLVGDIVESSNGGATFMAACPNASTARECLNSGRWMSNHIYYPKETQKAVELKAEPIGDDNGGGEEVEEEDEDVDNVEVWADSVAQAAGDVHERKFWGGGW